jgi:hypothetical protein
MLKENERPDVYLLRVIARLAYLSQELVMFAHLNKDVQTRFNALIDARKILVDATWRIFGEEDATRERQN